MSWGQRTAAGPHVSHDPRQSAFTEIFSRAAPSSSTSAGGPSSTSSSSSSASYGVYPSSSYYHHPPTQGVVAPNEFGAAHSSAHYYAAAPPPPPGAAIGSFTSSSSSSSPAPAVGAGGGTRRTSGGSLPPGAYSRSSVVTDQGYMMSNSPTPSSSSSSIRAATNPPHYAPPPPGGGGGATAAAGSTELAYAGGLAPAPPAPIAGVAHLQQHYNNANGSGRNGSYYASSHQGGAYPSPDLGQGAWSQSHAGHAPQHQHRQQAPNNEPSSALPYDDYDLYARGSGSSAPTSAYATSTRSSYSSHSVTQGSGPSTASTSSYTHSGAAARPGAAAYPHASSSPIDSRRPSAFPGSGQGPKHSPQSSYLPHAPGTPPLGYASSSTGPPRLPDIATQDDFMGFDSARARDTGSSAAPSGDGPAWVGAAAPLGGEPRPGSYYSAGGRSPGSITGSQPTYEEDDVFDPQGVHPSNYSTYEPSLYNGAPFDRSRRSSADSDRNSLYRGGAHEPRPLMPLNPSLNSVNHYHLPANGSPTLPQNSLNPRRSSESMRVGPTQLKATSSQDRAFSFSGERPDMRHTGVSSPTGRPISTISSGSAAVVPRRTPIVYPALLSRVAEAFKTRIVLSERVKDGLVYPDTFDGRDAVDKIAYIIRTSDRNLALLLGRALDAQKFFHDVTYDHRLRDSPLELYQFRERLASPFLSSDDLLPPDEYRSTISRRESVADTVASAEDSTPSGVFTLLTDCYSPTCTRDRLCYSIACPRRLEQQARLNLKIKPGLQRSVSSESLGDLREPGSLWIHSVPQDVADSTSDSEKKRQEALNEVFYTERDFVRDLEYLRDRWIKPLRTQNIIPEGRREEFINQVFWNVLEIHAVSVRLAELLNKRQKQSHVVHQIGDIFLELVPHFAPFVKYGAHQLYGKYEFEKEKGSNPAFAKFVDETERLPESRKLELNAYLTKPTTRLARYPLLLEACLKHTPDDNPDKVNLPKVVKLVREFLGKVNIETGKSENRFNLAQLDQQLVFKHGEAVVSHQITMEEQCGIMLTRVLATQDLRLRDEDREMIFKGPLKKRGGTQSESAELQVFLFDHAILMVKQKSKNEQYKVYRKPIPLELLVVAPIDDTSSGRAVAIRPRSLMARGSNTKYPAQPPPGVEKNSKQGYALTFIHLGRRGYQITVWASSWTARKKWLEKIEARQNELRDRSLVFETLPLTAGYFVGTNRLTCAAPFDNGNRMVYGTDNGVYLSDLREKNKVPVKVVSVLSVTQLDVLEEQGILIVLADKAVQTFFVDHLDPGDAIGAAKRARKISSSATFFKAGQCLGRTLVCVVKSGSVSSTIKTLEPIDQVRGKKQPAIRKFLQGSNESLRVFKEFYIPNESSSIHFLKSKLCVGCTKGFEIVDLETLDTQGLLDPADSSLDFVQKRETARPIAIYRIDGEFLLCYDEFAFYVNKNGWRAKSNWIIQWEGFPTHFALHYPYVLAFEPTFIEVRHVESGALMQIIPGNNIRCLFADTPPSSSSNAAYHPAAVNNPYGYGRYPIPAGPPARNEIIVADGDRAFSLQFTG